MDIQQICLAPGSRIGRWTVLEDWITTPKGEKKYLCRCDCGTERYVLERSLKYGGSKSCGCLTRERAYKVCAYELTGKQFGDLTVEGKSEKRNRMGVLWACRCTCGRVCLANASQLMSGRKAHCGCKSKKRHAADIAGKQFGRLMALEPTSGRRNGSVVWHCRCDCGNEVDVSYNDLVYANQRSCGCKKREHEQTLAKYLTHVDGTCIDILKSKKIPSNNTTGVKGVYLIKGRYVAKIVFQKKQFFLGTYDTLEEAAEVRALAEQTLADEVVSFYALWSEKAAADPSWAKANPMRISVVKSGNAELKIDLMPHLLLSQKELAWDGIPQHTGTGE